ncbi:hypothetical protein Bca101_068990 [Brassica carinata]
MTHRYSRAAKGKWKDDRPPFRKPLVKIPVSDSSDLIERNRLTLIGRVTNPSIQNTRALADFFLQQWNVVGRITGRDLGPSLFQFGFESEQDLQAILSKAHFHFKRWMMILQRWEPVVSESFPAAISFWIKVHGVPLHYWLEETFDAIGAALGPIELCDYDRARMKVQINGLEPLIMRMDIQLPSKKVIEVELEYEKLEKHCFFCKSLSHEDEDCELRPPSKHGRDNRPFDTAQQNTLDRIEESKRRQEVRKQSRSRHAHAIDGARWTNYKHGEPRNAHYTDRDGSSRMASERSSEFEENKRRYDDRGGSVRSNLSSRKTPPRRESQEKLTSGFISHSRNLPLPRLPAKPLISPTRDASSKSNHSPGTTAAPVQRRSSLASRLSDPRDTNSLSEERIPAKERLSVHTQRTSQMERTEAQSNFK